MGKSFLFLFFKKESASFEKRSKNFLSMASIAPLRVLAWGVGAA
jgi:hypothetical protein